MYLKYLNIDVELKRHLKLLWKIFVKFLHFFICENKINM